MLFHPGAFLQFVLTIIFFALVLLGCFSFSKLYTVFVSGKAYLQQRQIEQLTKELEECKSQRVGADAREEFYQKNIEILKRNCTRKSKPVVRGDRLDLENLFNGGSR